MSDIETTNEGSSLKVAGERVKVPDTVMNALRAYWDVRSDIDRSDAPLFTGEGTHKRRPMSARTIGNVVKDIAQGSGVDVRSFTPRSLKHTAVRLALQGGNRIEDVKNFARHRYIGTTSLYGGMSKRRPTCGDTVAAAIF